MLVACGMGCPGPRAVLERVVVLGSGCAMHMTLLGEGLHWIRVVAVVDPDPRAQEAARRLYPGVTVWDDVTCVSDSAIESLGPVEGVISTLPCTSLSLAGDRGADDGGGRLLLLQGAEFSRRLGPRWIVAENSGEVMGRYKDTVLRSYRGILGVQDAEGGCFVSTDSLLCPSEASLVEHRPRWYSVAIHSTEGVVAPEILTPGADVVRPGAVRDCMLGDDVVGVDFDRLRAPFPWELLSEDGRDRLGPGVPRRVGLCEGYGESRRGGLGFVVNDVDGVAAAIRSRHLSMPEKQPAGPSNLYLVDQRERIARTLHVMEVQAVLEAAGLPLPGGGAEEVHRALGAGTNAASDLVVLSSLFTVLPERRVDPEWGMALPQSAGAELVRGWAPSDRWFPRHGGGLDAVGDSSRFPPEVLAQLGVGVLGPGGFDRLGGVCAGLPMPVVGGVLEQGPEFEAVEGVAVPRASSGDGAASFEGDDPFVPMPKRPPDRDEGGFPSGRPPVVESGDGAAALLGEVREAFGVVADLRRAAGEPPLPTSFFDTSVLSVPPETSTMGEGERDLIVAGPLVVHDFYPSWEVRGRPPPPRPPPEFVRIRRRRLVTIEDITHAGALRRLREYCGALIGDDRLCAVGRAHRQRVVEPFFMRADELFVGWAVGYLWDTSDQKGVFVVDPGAPAGGQVDAGRFVRNLPRGFADRGVVEIVRDGFDDGLGVQDHVLISPNWGSARELNDLGSSVLFGYWWCACFVPLLRGRAAGPTAWWLGYMGAVLGCVLIGYLCRRGF